MERGGRGAFGSKLLSQRRATAFHPFYILLCFHFNQPSDEKLVYQQMIFSAVLPSYPPDENNAENISLSSISYIPQMSRQPTARRALRLANTGACMHGCIFLPDMPSFETKADRICCTRGRTSPRSLKAVLTKSSVRKIAAVIAFGFPVERSTR